MSAVQFDHFSAFYKLKKEYVVALDNVSLAVEKGEFAVIVGPSGCGKTTLLKCILGSVSLTDGSLTIDGIQSEKFNRKDNTIAYVSQEYSLYPQMTIYENIAFPLRVMRTPQSEVDRRVKEIAAKLEISLLLTRKPAQLSGGQHQRVALARALIKNPRLLLCDEPFSNLDPTLRLEMRTLIKKLHSEQRPTIIFVTHDLSEALMLADKIVVMHNGAIVERSTPEEIENNPQSLFTRRFFGK